MKGVEMYFNPQIVKGFADHEQNEKNFTVASIIDAVIVQTVQNIDNTFKAVEL
jgi:hypothetical protein